MIIKLLLDLVYSVVSVLTVPINIPSLPAGVQTAFADFLGYIQTGIAILSTYTHMSYLLVLFGLVVSVDVGIMLYKFVMWVLKKIPMLGIK